MGFKVGDKVTLRSGAPGYLSLAFGETYVVAQAEDRGYIALNTLKGTPLYFGDHVYWEENFALVEPAPVAQAAEISDDKTGSGEVSGENPAVTYLQSEMQAIFNRASRGEPEEGDQALLTFVEDMLADVYGIGLKEIVLDFGPIADAA